jgi:hypothetical protein
LINGLEQITVTENEVEDILKILDTSKAIGPDLLNPRLLKEAASILKYPLCTLFNLSLTLSTFPSEWKYANVTRDVQELINGRISRSKTRLMGSN